MKSNTIDVITNASLNRRDFLKISGGAVCAMTLPDIGCATFSKKIPYIDYSRELVLKNCHVIDVEKGICLENAFIQIDHGKIIAVDTTPFNEDKHSEVIDLGGHYVIPGMIDAHCHATLSSAFYLKMFQEYKHLFQQERNFRLCIESGVTTIRDVGSLQYSLQWFIDRIKNGHILGPRVIFCNGILNIKGGHPEVNPTDINMFANYASFFIGNAMTNFETIDDLKIALEKNTQKASFIKLTVDNQSVFCKNNLSIPVYSDDHLSTIFNEAEKKDLPVVCHQMSKWGFDRMSQYPVHSMEHMVSDAYISDKEAIKVAQKKIAIVPTLTVGQSYAFKELFPLVPKEYQTEFIENEIDIKMQYLNKESSQHIDPSIHQQNLGMIAYYQKVPCSQMWDQKIFMAYPDPMFGLLKYGVENLKKLKQAGALIGCGMDAGVPLCYFGSLYRECELLSRVGFTNHEVLQCATINNAKILRMENSIGSIQPGKYADLVVLNENPLKEIKSLRNPLIVMKDGQIMISKLPVHRNKQTRMLNLTL